MKRTPLTRRTPLRAKTPLRSKKPLRSKSDGNARTRNTTGDSTKPQKGTQRPKKRPPRKTSGFPAEIKKAALARDGGCKARRVWPDVSCYGILHCHHVTLRSQGGADTLDNALMLCEAHHRHAHDVDRAGAEAAGIIRRGSTMRALASGKVET